jgi:signal transduction histidine kinase/ActR/RegA family two-component response regulator
MIRDHPRYQSTAIIFVSAIQISDLDRLRGYELGAVDYVPVPVVPKLLRAKVRVFADLYRKTRELHALNAELERRVEQRTAELARTNAELEQRVEERTAEREAALAQVHEMQKMESLGQLTGGVAHDFNNLLMAILGNLQMLRKRVGDDARSLRLIDGATQGADRGATLTKRMLAFARRQELRPTSVDVGQLIGSIDDMLRRTLGPTIQIGLEIAGNLPAVRVDANQLELALLNLALNARDAMPLGGSLTMSAHALPHDAGPANLAAGPYVRLSVADSGTGMDDDVLRRATEPFYTTKGPGKGTGLGLSMVHGLAAQSGGAMRMLSGIGRGTTVELWLPVSADAQAIPPGGLDAATPAIGSCRILLVDDDSLILTTTSEMLRDLGHSVVEAASGQAALDILRRGTPIDLLLTDHAMPMMTGMELARAAYRERPGLPVVIASGYAELPQGEAPGEAFDGLRLSKPYRQTELAAAIARGVGTDPASASVIPFDLSRRA